MATIDIVVLCVLVLFGIFGMILTYITNPLIIGGLNKINPINTQKDYFENQ